MSFLQNLRITTKILICIGMIIVGVVGLKFLDRPA